MVCIELLRAVRSLLSEHSTRFGLWPDLITMVQSVLNHTVLDRLGRRAPITAFTGMVADSPLLQIKLCRYRKPVLLSVDRARARQLLRIDSLMSSIDQMHREISEININLRSRKVESHNRKTNAKECNFIVADFVLKGSVKRYESKSAIM